MDREYRGAGNAAFGDIVKAKPQHKNDTKKFDYTIVADRPRTVSWSDYMYSHSTGVTYRFTGQTFPLFITVCNQQKHVPKDRFDF